ncbi:MAG: Fic family protein, partial [Clostridia bacterium]|nr:Fic family protein [Clostridia bacterium]
YFVMLRGHPPIIVLDERKKEYYGALESYDRNEDLTPMYAFLRSETCATWEKALTRASNGV